ncbi:M24 family metallopeptidase [Haloplanus aerogenes]|uniref:Aminopeptidase P family protein n=1 Tax=Haloplanus aerogenes TaxID=660522 RepID=A0A3M0CWZ3_9EURY|nr:Xaa-Pro peptidase family protein [Haloplanus aerogenes]AZH25069.1 aminopeptidase P family protein [Haloplanus aerogenes]RMB13711.1 Xaa-Pro aminopeptidase [Haloplanus aerogenes]
MQPDLSALATTLGADHDGYLLDADGTDSTQRYLSGFGAPDPFVTCYTPDGVHLLVSGLEYGRAKKEARAATVSRLSAYDYRDRVGELGRETGRGVVVADFLADHGVESVLVPGRFPLGTADGLREAGVTVEVDEADAVAEIRAVKTPEEIDHVRRAQRANERAMAAAESLLESATVVEGVLHHDGDALTSEAVRREIELTLLEEGCALDETIVACGADAADPHDRGSGPLRADEPIVIDIFPRDTETRYHADMTRTFLKGEPSATLREWFDLTDEARRAALDAVEPGVTGATVHDAVCDVYEDAGLPTLRSDPDAETGFIHSTGHGVGLDVHELPRIAPDGAELEPRNVITIEPGLYDPDVGGVRIEDLVVVTEDGYENLTEYPVELVV